MTVLSVKTRAEPIEVLGSLPRAIVLIRAIARAGTRGATISRLVAATNLPRPTVNRVLNALEQHEWVERDSDTKAYFLGRELMCLGFSAAQRHPLETVAAPLLTALAEESGQTIYLSVRSGFDAVCVARHAGASPVQTVAQFVGARFPLGHGAGSLALLAALPDGEAEEIIAHNRTRYGAVNPRFDEAVFRAALDEARALGFARHHGLHVRGLSGIGSAVGTRARPVAAISSAFVTDWLSEEDQHRLATRMQHVAHDLARALGLAE